MRTTKRVLGILIGLVLVAGLANCAGSKALACSTRTPHLPELRDCPRQRGNLTR